MTAVPHVRMLAVLWHQAVIQSYRQAAAAAQASNLDVVSLELQQPDSLEALLATARDVDALNVVASSTIASLAPRIVAFAAQARLPAMYGTTAFARAGGLMTFSTNIDANFKRAGAMVARILAGARPGDLPIERPTAHQFIVNLDTARALGVQIPSSVLLQATEVLG